MANQLNVDEKLPDLLAIFSNTSEVQAVFLFGSYGTPYQTTLSDIDFAVLFRQDKGLSEELELHVRLSEVLETDRIDLVNLRKAPLRLQFKAISQGRLIYERDAVTTSDYIEYVVNRYQDYAIDLEAFYREYDRSLKEAYSDGRPSG